MKKYGIMSLWAASILLGFLGSARADYEWMITRHDGGVVMASQLKFGDNRVGWMPGRINMVETMIQLSEVQQMIFEKQQDAKANGEIVMTSGTRARLTLDYLNFSFVSEFGNAYMKLAEVRSIERSDGTLPAAGLAGGMAVSGADLITMKNGDVLAGTIATATFGLRTSYGDLAIDAQDIATIQMEGGGQNIEMVQLRSGEKISGVLTNEVFLLQRGSGAEMTLQKDKIKSMAFKAER